MKRVAIYAGTFDPFTLGHLSVVETAAKAFDRVVVLVAVHPTKKPMFQINERVTLIEKETEHLPGVTCDSTNGLVVEYARCVGAHALVRGVRGATDVEYETELATFNRNAAPEIATFFLPADPGLAQVSSSALKKIAREGRDGTRFCSPLVWQALINRIYIQQSRFKKMNKSLSIHIKAPTNGGGL